MSFAQSPVDGAPNVIRIVKLSFDHMEQAIVISEGMEGVQTHYCGRTMICGGPDCSLCFEGRPTRFLGFVVVKWRLGVGLLRLTSGPATQLMGMGARPGLALMILQKSARSPILLRKEGFERVARGEVVTQLELLNCLSHLFGVGSVDFNASYDVNIETLRVLALKQAAIERLPMAN